MTEADREETGKVQSFYNSLPASVVENDPIFKNFKKSEVDATMAAASNGAFHTVWGMDKLSELNNLVDSDPSVVQSIKDVFAPGASKNARLRGNRIGKVIFERAKVLMQQGGVPAPAAPAAPAAAPAPAAEPAASSADSQVSSRAAHSTKMLVGRVLKKFTFSPDLPADCQLRVRASPSMDGEPVGTVTARDTIMGTLDLLEGDWLRVQIGGWQDEAWMLTAMGGQQLLVLDDEQTRAPPVTQPISTPMASAPTTPSHSYSATVRPTATPLNLSSSYHGTSVEMRTHNPASFSNADPMNMSIGNMSMMMRGIGAGGIGSDIGGDATIAGQPVPYEMYRRLEIRVNKLEAELNALKMALRSI